MIDYVVAALILNEKGNMKVKYCVYIKYLFEYFNLNNYL
jgi:hypothetical protein